MIEERLGLTGVLLYCGIKSNEWSKRFYIKRWKLGIRERQQISSAETKCQPQKETWMIFRQCRAIEERLKSYHWKNWLNGYDMTASFQTHFQCNEFFIPEICQFISNCSSFFQRLNYVFIWNVYEVCLNGLANIIWSKLDTTKDEPKSFDLQTKKLSFLSLIYIVSIQSDWLYRLELHRKYCQITLKIASTVTLLQSP